jgi:hypothetical protein
MLLRQRPPALGHYHTIIMGEEKRGTLNFESGQIGCDQKVNPSDQSMRQCIELDLRAVMIISFGTSSPRHLLGPSIPSCTLLQVRVAV